MNAEIEKVFIYQERKTQSTKDADQKLIFKFFNSKEKHTFKFILGKITKSGQKTKIFESGVRNLKLILEKNGKIQEEIVNNAHSHANTNSLTASGKVEMEKNREINFNILGNGFYKNFKILATSVPLTMPISFFSSNNNSFPKNTENNSNISSNVNISNVNSSLPVGMRPPAGINSINPNPISISTPVTPIFFTDSNAHLLPIEVKNKGELKTTTNFKSSNNIYVDKENSNLNSNKNYSRNSTKNIKNKENSSGNYKILFDQNYSGIKKRNTPDEERKKYVISIPNIINNKDMRTTLMIKNIPSHVNQVELLKIISKNYSKAYNFFYLPIDFNKKLNAGYAFINFKSAKLIINFFLELENQPWDLPNCGNKICYLSYARIQGFRSICEHFEKSNIMKQIDEKVKPIIILD
jgi:hypothetical protein